MSRTPGSPASSGRPAGWRGWGREVEPAPGCRQPRHLEGQRAAADARRGGLEDQRREDVGAVVGPPGQHQAVRPGRHLRRGGLRRGGTADPRARQDPPAGRGAARRAARSLPAGQARCPPPAPGRALAPARLMAGRIRAATPAGSCPDCLSWGASYGSQSYCRACYDFTRRYGRGQCGGCRRVIAVKKGHCRLCWLQAGIAAAGRRRITPEDFSPAGYWQLSLAGMSRLGGTGPAPRATAAGPPAPAGPAVGTQLELRVPGESRHFDARHWVASRIDGEALTLTRRIAPHPAGPRGWNARIVIETGRALAVVLADHAPGDMIAWSGLSPALHSRDLSVTRTAEILDLAGLLDDDRVSSFTALMRARLALLPAPMAADVRDWLRTRSQGGPRSRPRDEHTVRMNLNRVHPLLLAWARHYAHLREVTAADVTAATGPLHGSLRRQTLTALRSLFGHARKTGTIFRDPPRGVRGGQRPLTPIQPLQPAEIHQATSAAATPAARLAVALAAIHAARPKTIRELHLGDIDLGGPRLVIAGRARPLDDLTRSLLLA